MELLQGYIYNSQPQQATRDSFIHRHRYKLGVILSLAAHFSIMLWIYYQGVFAPYVGMSIVDDAYNDVKWIELNTLTKPLKYPAQMLPQPGKVVALDQMDKVRAEIEAKRKAEEAKKRKQEQDSQAKDSPDQDSKDNKDNSLDKDSAAQDTSTNKTEDGTKTADNRDPEADKPKTPPRFGAINGRPIKEIIGKVYATYKDGHFDLNSVVFSITIGFEVNKDGSFSDVHIIKTSGSAQIDATAINVATALSESHAMVPLAALSSNTATLELNPEKAAFIVAGFATTADDAANLSSNFSQQAVGLRLLLSFKNPEAAQMLSHLTIATEGNQLIATMSMPRAEADSLMNKGFKGAAQPEGQPTENKTPENSSNETSNPGGVQ